MYASQFLPKRSRTAWASTGTYKAALGITSAVACLILLAAPALATTPAQPGSATLSRHALPSLKGTNLPAIRIRNAARANPAGIPVQDTTSWSGYVAVPKSGGSQSFNSVTAQYTVPSLNCSVTGKDNALAYHGVGLDGWTDGTVEQDGVAEFCVSGTPEYYDYYSMVTGSPGSPILEYAVNPGDDIDSSVTYNPATKLYTLVVTDRTNPKWSFTKNEACVGTCENSSAEVISQAAPSTFYLGTADFGAEFYIAATATDAAGVTGSLTNSNWSTVEAIAYGPASHTFMSAPGQIYEGESLDRSAFVVNWNSVN